MPDSKHMKWDESFGTDAEPESKVDDGAVPVDEPAANDADGWQQYRRWISNELPIFLEKSAGFMPAFFCFRTL